jgi:hypothetical protein
MIGAEIAKSYSCAWLDIVFLYGCESNLVFSSGYFYPL